MAFGGLKDRGLTKEKGAQVRAGLQKWGDSMAGAFSRPPSERLREDPPEYSSWRNRGGGKYAATGGVSYHIKPSEEGNQHDLHIGEGRPLKWKHSSAHGSMSEAMNAAADHLAEKESARSPRWQKYHAERAQKSLREGEMDKSQIISGVSGHPKNSRRWPDPSPTQYGEGWDDGIRKDGTDYMGKSFAQHASEYPVIMDGMEVSEFLGDVVKSIAEVFETFEDHLNTQIDAVFEQNAEFDKSLGESVVHIGKGIHEVGERIGYLEEQIDKSFGPQQPGDLGYLQKGGWEGGLSEGADRNEIMGALLKGVEAGRIDALEVIKYESGNELSPDVRKSLGL